MGTWSTLLIAIASACLGVLLTLELHQYIPGRRPTDRTSDGRDIVDSLITSSTPVNTAGQTPSVDVAQALGLGRLLLARGEADAAAFAFRAAGPRSPEAVEGLGRALHLSGQIDEALQACREAEQLDPSLTSAAICTGTLLAEAGDSGAAVAAFRRATNIDPDNVDAHARLGAALTAAGDVNPALATLEYALTRAEDPITAYNLGVALQRKGRIEEAMAAYLRGVDLAPHLAAPRVNLGALLLQQGRPDEAEAMLLSASELSDDELTLAATYSNLGAAMIERERREEALDMYVEAIKHNSNDRITLVHLSKLYDDMGRPDEALKAAERAIEVDPGATDASPYLQAGLILEKQGKISEALAHFEEGHRLDSTNVKCLVHAGTGQQALGQFHEAVESFAQASRLAPQSAELYDLLESALKEARNAFERNQNSSSADVLDENDESIGSKPGFANTPLGAMREHLSSTLVTTYKNAGEDVSNLPSGSHLSPGLAGSSKIAVGGQSLPSLRINPRDRATGRRKSSMDVEEGVTKLNDDGALPPSDRAVPPHGALLVNTPVGGASLSESRGEGIGEAVSADALRQDIAHLVDILQSLESAAERVSTEAGALIGCKRGDGNCRASADAGPSSSAKADTWRRSEDFRATQIVGAGVTDHQDEVSGTTSRDETRGIGGHDRNGSGAFLGITRESLHQPTDSTSVPRVEGSGPVDAVHSRGSDPFANTKHAEQKREAHVDDGDTPRALSRNAHELNDGQDSKDAETTAPGFSSSHPEVPYGSNDADTVSIMHGRETDPQEGTRDAYGEADRNREMDDIRRAYSSSGEHEASANDTSPSDRDSIGESLASRNDVVASADESESRCSDCSVATEDRGDAPAQGAPQEEGGLKVADVLTGVSDEFSREIEAMSTIALTAAELTAEQMKDHETVEESRTLLDSSLDSEGFDRAQGDVRLSDADVRDSATDESKTGNGTTMSLPTVQQTIFDYQSTDTSPVDTVEGDEANNALPAGDEYGFELTASPASSSSPQTHATDDRSSESEITSNDVKSVNPHREDYETSLKNLEKTSDASSSTEQAPESTGDTRIDRPLSSSKSPEGAVDQRDKDDAEKSASAPRNDGGEQDTGGGRSPAGNGDAIQVSEEDKRRAKGKVQIGLARLQQGQRKKALKMFEKAAEIDPGWWGGFYYTALAHYDGGDHQAAAQALSSAVRVPLPQSSAEMEQLSALISNIVTSTKEDTDAVKELKEASNSAGLVLSSPAAPATPATSSIQGAESSSEASTGSQRQSSDEFPVDVGSTATMKGFDGKGQGNFVEAELAEERNPGTDSTPPTRRRWPFGKEARRPRESVDSSSGRRHSSTDQSNTQSGSEADKHAETSESRYRRKRTGHKESRQRDSINSMYNPDGRVDGRSKQQRTSKTGGDDGGEFVIDSRASAEDIIASMGLKGGLPLSVGKDGLPASFQSIGGGDTDSGTDRPSRGIGRLFKRLWGGKS